MRLFPAEDGREERESMVTQSDHMIPRGALIGWALTECNHGNYILPRDNGEVRWLIGAIRHRVLVWREIYRGK